MTNKVNPIVYQIVDSVRVSLSDRQVIGTIASRMREGRKTWLAMPKGRRRAWIWAALRRHQHNQRIYRYATRGNA